MSAHKTHSTRHIKMTEDILFQREFVLHVVSFISWYKWKKKNHISSVTIIEPFGT